MLVLADDEWLYFGFRVFDSQPEAIEARQTRRDAGLGFDDVVIIELDTFRNFRHISKFSVNALGTQQDEIAAGSDGASYSNGDLGGGPYEYLQGYFWIRPRRDLYFSLTGEWLDSFGTATQVIAIAKWDITATDAVGGRVVVSDSNHYYRLTYGRQVRRGVDVFAVIDHQPDLDTQFSVKLLFTLP